MIINTASVHHNLLLADSRLLTIHVNLFVQIIRLQIHHDSKRPGNVGPAYLSRETELRKWHTHTLPPPHPPKNVLRSSVGNSPSIEALPRLPPPCSSKGPFPPVGAIPGGLQVHI